ncbi:uncharacterized protein [Oscarella lobularis]|uniref:uncharacterized protein isoform X1 n=1 Tax=Oscarella lobularis TaxID=121494 RepID=UPI0033131279
MVLAIASTPSLFFLYPNWDFTSERLEQIVARRNVSFANGSSCNVEISLPSSVATDLLAKPDVQKLLSPSLLPLLRTPKCFQLLNVLWQQQSSESVFQTLTPFEIRGIMRTLNVSFDELRTGLRDANISISAVVSLINSYCLDRFTDFGCQKDLMLRNDSSPCCYVSCLNWNWLGESKRRIDLILFAVTTIAGFVVLVAATVSIIAIKSKQKFPHLMVSFYILLSLMTMPFSELVGRLLGRDKALCCGEQDLLKALRSDSCTFSIVRTMIQNFGYVSSVSWGVVGFVNLWIAIVLSKSRLFATSKNTIHAVEAFLVWGTAFVLAVGPYWLEGESAYYNPLLCYSCSTIRNSLLYNLFLVLPQQVNIAVGGLCAVHLVYTLKKQSLNRQELFSSVQVQDLQQKKHVSQLNDLQRRFAFLLVVVFVVEIIIIINSFIVYAVRDRVNLNNFGSYVECVYLALEDECQSKEKSIIENVTFAFLIVYRLAFLASLFFLVVFFWTAKDFRKFWKNIYERCYKRTRPDDKVNLRESCSERSFNTQRGAPTQDLELS